MTGCAPWGGSGGGTSSAGALGDRGCLPVGCRAPSVGSMATNVSRDLFGMGAWPPGVIEALRPVPEPTGQRRRDRHHRGRQDNPAAGVGTPAPVQRARACPGRLRRAGLGRSAPRVFPSAARRLVFANVCPPEAGEVLRALGDGRHHGSLLAIDVVVRLDREASSSRRAAEVCRVEAGAGGWALRPA